jgi:hypothetical protein
VSTNGKKLNTFLEPNYDGALMHARHTNGGFRIAQNQGQMLSIPFLYRTERTIVFLQDSKILYQLKTPIPTSATTTMNDWEPIELGGASSFRPVGEWDPNLNEPYISDATAAGRNGDFWFIKNTSLQTPFTFSSDPVIFEGNEVTLVDGNMVVSVGGYWVAISQTTTWDAMVKPAVINEYVAGIGTHKNFHTHLAAEITDLETYLDAYLLGFESGVNTAYLEANYYNKTFTDATFLRKIGDSGVFAFTFANNQGIDSDGTVGTDVLNIGTVNADIINIGRIGATINLLGTVVSEDVTNLAVEDKLIRLNVNGGAGTASGVGFEIEEGGTGVITGYFKTNATRDGYLMNAPSIDWDAEFMLSGLTGNRTYTLPDVSGTLALVASTLSTTLTSANIWLGNVSNVATQVVMSGDVTMDNAGVTLIGNDKIITAKILNSNVTFAKFQNISTDVLLGRDTAATGIVEEIGVGGGIEFNTGALRLSAFTGDVTKTAGGTTLTIADDAVTYAKIQNVSATNRFLGRITGGAGDVEELTGTQATTLLDVFTDALKGLAPASGGGTSNFLRADGSWTAPGGAGHVIFNGADVGGLTTRANLRVRNGLTATDSAPDTMVELGGALVQNTSITGTFWLTINTSNFALFSGAPNFQSGEKIMFMGVATTPPAAAPATGIFMWVQQINSNYELRIMDSNGNIKSLS